MDDTLSKNNIKKYSTSKPFTRFTVNRFLRDLNELVRSTNACEILDAGCGEGFVSKYLKNHNDNISIQGLDTSHSALTFAENRNVLDTIRASVYAMPFKKNSFDLILCCEVLEHLSSPQRAVIEIIKASKGWFIFSVPREPFFRVANILGLKYLTRLGNIPSHIQGWTKKGFQNFLENFFDEISIKTSTRWTIALCKKKNAS